MVGRSDRERYGQLQVYVMPRGALPNGPALVQGEIQSDAAVSQQETLLGGTGSDVSFGSLTAIPIDGGLVYVRPFYVTSNETEIPGLEKVIVYFEGEVAIENTLQEALTEVFGESPPTLEEDPGQTPADPEEPPEPSGSIDEQVASLLLEASTLFDEADERCRTAISAPTPRRPRRPGQLIDQAEQLLEESGVEGTVPDDEATTTTTAATDGAST